jgi:hypothetical protein
MTDTATCDRLNDLLVNLGRSLLQYAGEAWPWTAATDSADVRTLIGRLGAMQRASVGSLAQLLEGAGHSIDFGVYPAEYSSLHYVSLRYMLDQLIDNERDLSGQCRAAAAELPADSPAGDLLGEITRREEAILAELQAQRRG